MQENKAHEISKVTLDYSHDRGTSVYRVYEHLKLLAVDNALEFHLIPPPRLILWECDERTVLVRSFPSKYPQGCEVYHGLAEKGFSQEGKRTFTFIPWRDSYYTVTLHV